MYILVSKRSTLRNHKQSTNLAMATPWREATLKDREHPTKRQTPSQGVKIASNKTHNSTIAGEPFPMCVSQLSGVSSRTLDARAPPRVATAANRLNENLIVIWSLPAVQQRGQQCDE
jgi:hypothetical protein